MWLSCRQARKAADNERRRMEKRESKLIDERNAFRADSEHWQQEVTAMRIDQANSAGYVDGYNACRRETEADQTAAFSEDLITRSLRDGKNVAWAVYHH